MYEIIIKEDGEEKQRVSAKGFVFTVVNERGTYELAMVDGISSLEIALMINANKKLIDQIWKDCGFVKLRKR